MCTTIRLHDVINSAFGILADFVLFPGVRRDHMFHVGAVAAPAYNQVDQKQIVCVSSSRSKCVNVKLTVHSSVGGRVTNTWEGS